MGIYWEVKGIFQVQYTLRSSMNNMLITMTNVLFENQKKKRLREARQWGNQWGQFFKDLKTEICISFL